MAERDGQDRSAVGARPVVSRKTLHNHHLRDKLHMTKKVDCMAVRDAENDVKFHDGRIKQEPDYEVHTGKMKIKDSNEEREEVYMCLVLKDSTSSDEESFHAEDRYFYCGECKVKNEVECPKHGPWSSVDNDKTKRDVRDVHSGRDRNLSSSVKKTEESELCGEGEGTHSSIRGSVQISKMKHLEERKKHLEHEKQAGLSHMLPKYRHKTVSRVRDTNVDTGVSTGKISSVLPDGESPTSMDLTDCQNKAGDVQCEIQNGRKEMLNDESFSIEPAIMASTCDIDSGARLCEADVTYKTECKKKVKKCKTAPGEEKMYKCDVCDIEFTNANKLKRHKIIHAGKRVYNCNICGAILADGRILRRHKRVHTGEKPFKCDICGTGFAQSGNLKIHRRIHTGERPYSCGECGATFADSGKLKRHSRTHTGEKPYKCDFCGVEFTNRGVLNNHKRTHTGEKPYKCDICGIEFIRNSDLITHRIIHTGEKPYKCDVCGVAFAEGCSLKEHKRVHIGERPFKCDICGAGFAQSCSLTEHKRVHTGEKPYKCDVCNEEFTFRSVLQRHKTIHNVEKP